MSFHLTEAKSTRYWVLYFTVAPGNAMVVFPSKTPNQKLVMIELFVRFDKHDLISGYDEQSQVQMSCPGFSRSNMIVGCWMNFFTWTLPRSKLH